MGIVWMVGDGDVRREWVGFEFVVRCARDVCDCSLSCSGFIWFVVFFCL